MADFGKLNFSVAFNYTSAIPDDARTYFTSLEEAQAAAATAEEVGSTNTVYYFGQKLLVYENGVPTWYMIHPVEPGKPGGKLVAEGGGADEVNSVSLLIDGVNYSIDNLSEPVETDEENTYALDLN